MQPIDFYHQHLEKVSRSFSFCIMQLNSPAREWIALSYLLCRIVDTIEDSSWAENQLQTDAFETLQLFLNTSPSAAEFQSWLQAFPNTIVLPEQQLLLDLPLLLSDKNELPVEIQCQLVKTISQMMAGMSYFLKQYQREDKLVLPSLALTNQYCFFVAGIVGELLTTIHSFLIPEFECTDSLLIQSFHFGLFLQKINLLKDQARDELAGRYYISSRESLRNSLFNNAQEAFNYLKLIPIVSGRTYRLFCAWSLWIGLASLKWIDKSWHEKVDYKISVRETTFIMNQVKQRIDDNGALEELFKHYLPSVPDFGQEIFVESDEVSHQSLPNWFSTIYSYPFSSEAIVALGI